MSQGKNSKKKSAKKDGPLPEDLEEMPIQQQKVEGSGTDDMNNRNDFLHGDEKMADAPSDLASEISDGFDGRFSTARYDAHEILVGLTNKFDQQDAPQWEVASKSAWIDFHKKFLRYKRNGGQRRIQECVSPMLLLAIQYMLEEEVVENWDEVSDQAIIDSMLRYYGISDTFRISQELESIFMKQEVNIDNLALYVYTLESKLVELNAQNSYPEKLKVKLFLRGLSSEFQLKKRMYSRVEELELIQFRSVVRETFRIVKDVCTANELLGKPKSSKLETNERVISNKGSNNKYPVTNNGKEVTSGDAKVKINIKKTVNGVESSNKVVRKLCCFNCDGEHMLKDCTKDIDIEKVRLKKQKYLEEKERKYTKMKDSVKVLHNSDDDMEEIADVIDVKVVNTELCGTALVDTGAKVACISISMAEKLKCLGMKSISERKGIGTVDGDMKTVNEYMNVCLTTMDDKPVKFDLKVWVLNTQTDFIIDVKTAREVGLVILTGKPSVRKVELTDYVQKMCMWPSEVSNNEGMKDNDSYVSNTTNDDTTFDTVKEEIRSRIEEGPIKNKIYNMLCEYYTIFDGKLESPAKVEPFEIQLEVGQHVIKHAPRPLSAAMEEVVRKELSMLQDMKIIRESSSNIVSPIVMVNKGEGEYRMCIDYRALNMYTVPVRYPVRNTRSILDRIIGSKYFATLDFQKGYHQVPMDPDSIKYTAFAVPWGLYEYVRLPFGVRNGPAKFQQVMDKIFASVLYFGVEVFVDDLLVHGKTEEEFLERLEKVLKIIKEHNLKVKVSKSKFGYSDVNYIGYHIDNEGFAITEKHRNAIQQLGVPRNRAELRSLNGLLNYFKIFIARFAWLCKPLFGAASGKGEFNWTPECDKSLETLKELIGKLDKLYYVDNDKMLYLQTDASTQGVGGALYQYDKGRKRYIVFLSIAFNEVQMRWSTIEQEGFAVYFCIVQCERYLAGVDFILETDHRNLQWLENSKAPKLVRWWLRIQEFRFKIQHIPGKQNYIADALSRIPVVAAINMVNDETEEEISELLEQKRYCEILRRVHGNGLGHKGITATLKILHDMGIKWSKMKDDVVNYIKNCVVCQKLGKYKSDDSNTNYHIEATQPFQKICLDTVGPLPEAKGKFKYIIVVVDVFSRYVELFAAKSTTAIEAAECLLKVFGRYGLPETIVSDQGTQYVNQIIKELLNVCGIQHCKSVPYRHQGNGICERVNFEVMHHLRYIMYQNEVKDQWDKYLSNVQYILNTSIHSSLGVCPMNIVYGSSVMSHRGIIREFIKPNTVLVTDYIKELDANLKRICDISKSFQDKVKERQSRGAESKPMEFMRGDKVLIMPHDNRSKLDPKWIGPFIVESTQKRTLIVKNVYKNAYLEVDRSMAKLFYNDNEDENVSDERIAAKDQDMFVVEGIINHEGNLKKLHACEFEVKWEGYKGTTWEPYRNLKDVILLKEYLRNQNVKGV